MYRARSASALIPLATAVKSEQDPTLSNGVAHLRGNVLRSLRGRATLRPVSHPPPSIDKGRGRGHHVASSAKKSTLHVFHVLCIHVML